MIHLRGIWLANGSGRSRLRERRAALEEKKRNTTADLANFKWDTSTYIYLTPLSELRNLPKREARLIQSNQYRQQGGA